MQLYIIRHGQTDYNLNNMVQGRGVNAPLNDTGRKQARAFYQAYKDFPFDQIYVSNLDRTAETVEQFINDGIPCKKLEGLDEISWGDQEGVAFTPESSTLYQQTVKRWRAGNLNLSVGGGETPIEVMQRQHQAIEQILAEGKEKVLVCMHGRAMRIMLCWMLNYDLSFMDEFTHGNLCLYKLSYTGSYFKADLFDDRKHLKNGLPDADG